jgi:peptide/nickel transport system substrate-binding protein
MHNFLTFIKEFRIPKKNELRNAKDSFSQRQLFVFATCLVAAFITMLIILNKVNNSFMVEVPTNGGTITEGIIGMPTLVNPVLAVSDADKDISALVYSGLMRKASDGTIVPDLADSYSASADGTTYTFTIRKNAKFQDGTALTADDVLFTIEKLKDPLVKSPRKVSWDGVTADKKDDHTVVFTLSRPYISFLDNTTIGILPARIWKNLSGAEFGLSGLNIKAVGSGPYQIDGVVKDKEGIPQAYKLKRFDGFVLGAPHIKYINIISYANEKDLVGALLNHSVDQAGGLSPENAATITSKSYTVHTATLPRMFGLFWNSANNKIFADTAVVHALDKAIDRQAIVNDVLSGYGTVIHSPIPENIMKDAQIEDYKNASVDEANTILDKGGWKMGDDGIRTKGGTTVVTQTKKVGKKTVTQKVTINNGPVTRLAFSLVTGDTPELGHTADILKEQLGKIGVQVDVKKYETGPLNQLIRGRQYEALFFGQVVNHESDLYSFWHSSQKADPGLNIAMYGNKTVDTILETAQKTLNSENRMSKYKDFVTEFNKDVPALLIYSPKYLYATSSKLNHVLLDTLTTPSDRFQSIYDWYADTDHVWKIFTK